MEDIGIMVLHGSRRKESEQKQRGVLVGADQSQEWILPWWWGHYQQKNSYPVAFVDFGLSFEMKKWCRERGVLIPLRVADFAAEKGEMDLALVRKFEADYGFCFWDCRNTWFKKPLACLQTPFAQTIWIDLDCEIRCCLDPLFSYEGLAMAKDQIALMSPYPVYNSGVMVFSRELEIVQKWAEAALTLHDRFRGDQELLSWMIAEENGSVTVLPAIYNWSRSLGENRGALIYHWHGVNGKKVIRHELSKKNLSELWES